MYCKLEAKEMDEMRCRGEVIKYKDVVVVLLVVGVEEM